MSNRREPLVEVAIEPKTKADQRKLETALAELAERVNDVVASVDSESGQTVLKGMSVAHLDQFLAQLADEGVNGINVGAPQVAYRERLNRQVEIDHTHKRLRGASGEFARVRIRFTPRAESDGYRFTNSAGASIPHQFIPAIEKGLNASRENGVLAGFPLIDFEAELIDGAFHEIDSNALTFEIATRAAFRELKEKKAVILLEPIMKVEVSTPDEYLGGVIGDINGRRGLVERAEVAGTATHVFALVPLANLFDFEAKLKSMTRGVGEATVTFSHYDEAPRSWSDDPSPFPPAVGMRA